jgi:hypothetical protein
MEGSQGGIMLMLQEELGKFTAEDASPRYGQ